jgi:hypothetical protein
MSTIKVDNLQTTSGAGQYPNKSWVNFNGSGTVSIRANGNVSSITDNGTGNYRANFSNSMTDSNYALLATHNQELQYAQAVRSDTSDRSTSSVTFKTMEFNNGNVNPDQVNVATVR